MFNIRESKLYKSAKGMYAFTLAEVLITLGIIGVVAALTIPTLVSNLSSRQYATASQVFYGRLQSAINRMNASHELNPYKKYKTTEKFVDALQKHLKITKVCDNEEITSCFDETILSDDKDVDISKLKTSTHIGQPDWNTNLVGLQFADGTSAIIAYNPGCESDPYQNSKDFYNKKLSQCFAILYDTNGYSSPNEMSKDVNKTDNITRLLDLDIEFAEPVVCTKFGGYGPCKADTVQAEATDVVITDFTQYDPTQVSSDGKRMTFDVAVKVCSDRGLRLPRPSEANSLYNKLGGFEAQNYWVTQSVSEDTCSKTSGMCTNCYMGAGNCGSKVSTALNYVRCVK